MPISWVNSDGKVGVSEDAYMYAADRQGQTRQSGAENSADVSNYDIPGSDLTSRMQMQDRYLNYKKQPLQAPYTNLPEQEFKDLMWDTPIASSKGGGPAASDIQDMLDMTDEEHQAHYDEAIKTFGKNNVIGGVNPSGRIRMRKDIEGFQEYLKNIPEGTSVHDLGDGTVILRKAPSKPPEVGSIDKGDWHTQLASFQQRLDNTPPAEASELQKFLGSLNIMPAPGKPQEEWTAKEHMGYMLNTAMSGMGGGFKAPPKGPTVPIPPKTMVTPLQAQLAKYEELSSQGKTTKQIVKGTKMEPEMVREALGRDNLAIAAFNSENALTDAYFKQLQTLDPKLGEALKKQVSIKDLKRFTRLLPEERLKGIFEDLPISIKESFESGEQRRMNIDAGKKSKIIAKPLKLGDQTEEYEDFMASMNKLSTKVDQKAFAAWLETAPESRNIEDRRKVNKPVFQKPLQKQYK